jgi:hypothetical protein
MKKALIIGTALLSGYSVVFISCKNAGTENSMKSEQKVDSLVSDKTEVSQKGSDKLLNKGSMIANESAIAKTLENMQAAYKGEVSATEKYAAYGKRAIADGYPEIALLYKAVSIA